MLESYGLASTSFNRFEDVQLQVGGTVGRNFYWRAQAANGNPLFIRDPNALAGDNGVPGQILRGERPELGSGFPILYNAETEDLFFDTSNVQMGEALGIAGSEGRTLSARRMVFHYKRDCDTVRLTAPSLWGLDSRGQISRWGRDRPRPADRGGRPQQGRAGARLYGEWGQATLNAQMTAEVAV